MKIVTNTIILLIITLLLLFIISSCYMSKKSNKEGFINDNRLYDSIDFNKTFNLPFDKCFVINLQETREGRRRWKVIKGHPTLKDYVSRFPGVYGRDYDFTDDIKRKTIYPEWDFGRWKRKPSKIIKMDKGELGCIMSHRNLWEKIVRDRIPSTLILEDDAINMEKNFIKKISEIKHHLPSDWDILLLGFWLHMGDNGYKVNSHIHRVGNFCLLHSYLVSYQGAEKLLKLGTIDMPLDTWVSNKSDSLNIYRHTIIRKNTRSVVSSLIRQNRQEKQIKNTNNW